MPEQQQSSAALPAPKPLRRPISRSRIEVIIWRSVAIFGLLFGAQTLPAVIAQQSLIEPAWWYASSGVIYGLLLLSVLASSIKRYVRAVNIALAVAFLLVLLLWVPAVAGGVWASPERPWPWFLMTVAAAAGAVAFRTWMATAYLVITPLLYAILRTTSYGGEAVPLLAFFDFIYAVLLGGAVLVIITMLRASAASVDAAQATALERYDQAVREHATEVERVQVDSIVHDSVLTAFLSAANSQSDEAKALAAALAGNAIRHLRDAEQASPDDDSLVRIETVVQRLSEVQGPLVGLFEISSKHCSGVIPAVAADALFSAALQSMVNSLQHAGDEDGIRRWVDLAETDGGGVFIEVGDTGRGFDVAEIPSQRLGVRVSILERLAGAGGHAVIDSVAGRGTIIRLSWPAGREAEEAAETEFVS